MKSRIILVCVAIAALFVVACPMPQVGTAHGRDAVGGEPGTPGGTAGSISVVNDAARGVAVYINESGARFDVAAAEYDGGPLVTCVDVSDFSIVPSSGDADALPVKAIVVGTRDDGSPGVWQINTDDTISLPQPEQSTDNPERSIVSGDMLSLPDGLQVRFGWTFKSLLTADGGKLIIGYAQHNQGFSYNGVYVAPTTKVGVYWRLYPIPFTRFCLVSSPRVIGILSTPPKPSWWPQRFLPTILVQLKQFLQGKFEAYLITPESVIKYDAATGVVTVKGKDDQGVTAVATFNRTTVESIIEVPDLAVKTDSISFSPNPVVQGGTLALAAVVTELTDGPALPSKVRFYLSADQTLDISSDKFLVETAVPAIDPMVSLDASVSASAIVPADLTTGVYYVIASVTDVTGVADEVVTTNNTTTAAAALTVTGTTSTTFYPHVVVDTFDALIPGPIPDLPPPDGLGGFPVSPGDNVIVELFSVDSTGALVRVTDGSSARPEIPVNGSSSVAYEGYGYFDAFNVPSGDYYVRVSLGNAGTQKYALRVVLDPSGPNYADWVYTDSTLPTLVATTTDAGSASFDPISVGAKTAKLLSRTTLVTETSDPTRDGANWFKFTLR